VANAGIYCIQNTIDGKCYIGKSINIPKRWKEHRASLRNGHHHNKHLQKAWDYYGEKSFHFKVLEYANPKELAELEIAYISKHKAFGENGYNFTMGGEGGLLGMPKTKETRRKISEANKGRLHTSEEKAKVSNALKGRTFTDEHRKKIGEANKTSHIKSVLCVETGQVFKSLKEAGEFFKTHSSNIGHACNGRQEKAKGFHFTYI
jgi:group I intron endonuclease